MRTITAEPDDFDYEDEYDPELYDTAVPTVNPTTGRWAALIAFIVVLAVATATRGV